MGNSIDPFVPRVLRLKRTGAGWSPLDEKILLLMIHKGIPLLLSPHTAEVAELEVGTTVYRGTDMICRYLRRQPRHW